MALLKLGSRGPDVAAIQKGLLSRGYALQDEGGVFGDKTVMAVKAFQRDMGLDPDGSVGDLTREALFPTPWNFRTGDLAEFTPLLVAKMFPGTRLSNIVGSLPHVLDGLAAVDLTDREMSLMALATVRAESASFLPVDEAVSAFNTDQNANPFNRYEPGTTAGDRLGNKFPGDGARFRGRGYVQLTGRFNYGRIGKQIGIDLIAKPEAANGGAFAGRILAQFLKNAEAPIRAALRGRDFASARKAVNGGRHGLPEFEACYRAGETLLS